MLFQISLIIGIWLFAGTDTANALTFTDQVTFPSNGNLFTEILDNNAAATEDVFAWHHDILNEIGTAPGSFSIENASLTIQYARTADQELWNVAGLGSLTASTGIIESSFPLIDSLLTDLETDGLLITTLREATSRRDQFRLYQARLTGEYEIRPATPEPGSLALILLGLASSLLRRLHYTKE